MSYRRLPNTDQARITALTSIADLENNYGFHDLPLSNSLVDMAKTQLHTFKNTVNLHRQAVEMWQEGNKKYREILKNLTVYITHFVQVYNMAILRGELKKEGRAYYNIDIEDDTLPDLSSEDNILDWGQRLTEGERQRTLNGGSPMTNPTISNLKVHYEKFTNLNFDQKIKKNYIAYTKEALCKEREKADVLIKEIWDEVEKIFAPLPEKERFEKCKEFGVIYYNRTSEKSVNEPITENIETKKFDIEPVQIQIEKQAETFYEEINEEKIEKKQPELFIEKSEIELVTIYETDDKEQKKDTNLKIPFD